MEFVLRFGYGQTIPWVRRTDFGLTAVAGPDAVELHSPTALKSRHYRTVSEFSVGAGEALPFALCWHFSHRSCEREVDVDSAASRDGGLVARLAGSRRPRQRRDNPWSEAVTRSLVTLKALTYRPTGGIIAAATTSLPERIGGERNWDYRYCWIRDATFTLYALLTAGYRAEANDWREWMLRAAAGHPSQLQIMYGLAGERRLKSSSCPGSPATRIPGRCGSAMPPPTSCSSMSMAS